VGALAVVLSLFAFELWFAAAELDARGDVCDLVSCEVLSDFVPRDHCVVGVVNFES
jgi:hypothetical protein